MSDKELLVRVGNVTKEYGKKDHLFKALDGVNLVINEGESVAIIGKSGSGKSTLMHVVSGLDHATSGQVVIDGNELTELKGGKLDAFRAGMIGFVFQSFFVQANETCADNVSLPLEIAGIRGAERKKRITQALEQVGLGEKANQKAKNLSGGQKQRLAVARAIVARPRILFADEPTGNLDSATGEQIEKLLFAINKSGTTLIVVTHDDELAARCDRQVRLRDGRIESDSGTRRRAKPAPKVKPGAASAPPRRTSAPPRRATTAKKPTSAKGLIQ